MKKLLYFALFNFVTLLSFSQTANVTEGCVPLSVSFSPPAGASSFFWDLGDGNTSTLASPDNDYTQPGVYTVNFSESNGGPVVGSFTISVYEKPVVDINVDPTTGCAPFNVIFADNSTVDPNITVDGYNWTFGFQGETGAGSTTNFTYNQLGSYTVSLALNSSLTNCTEIGFFPNLITVVETPVASFTATPTASCEAPLTVNFNNTSSTGNNLTYSWDFGNGTTSTEQNPPAVTYTTEGNFTVILEVTNEFDCISTFSEIVSIGTPSSDFNIPDTVCIGQVTMISAVASANQYQWSFGQNATPSTAAVQNVGVTFLQAGLNTVSLTVNTDGCTSTTEKEIFVQEVDLTYTIDPAFSCEQPFDVTFTPNNTDGIAGYSWIFNEDTLTVENPTFTYSYEDDNPYTIHEEQELPVSLTVTTTAGCTFEAPIDNVILHEPTAYFKADVVDGCAPLTVALQDSSFIMGDIVNWEWHWGDGMVETTTSSVEVSHTYNDAGDYEAFLIVTNAAGCMDTSFIQPILVGTELAIDFNVDQTEVCPGDTVQFTPIDMDVNIDEWHYETDNGRSWHCYQEDSASWSFITETGVFNAELVVGYNGCFSSVVKENLITVKGPIARLDYDVECDNPFEFNFVDSSYSATNVTWSFGDDSMSTDPNILYQYAERGEYTVILTAENTDSGCPASVDSTTVYVTDIKADFQLDTIVCSGTELMLDGSMSQDAFGDCYRGYTWFPPSDRPITTQDIVTPYTVQGSGPVEFALEVTDRNGCRDTAYWDMTLYEINGDFEFDKDRICFPTEVNFTDLSTADTTITEWEWDFGDMSMMSTEQNPTHVFSQIPPVVTGILTVTLRATDAVGCPGIVSKEITYYQPTSNIFTNPNNPRLCEGDDITFTATDFTSEGSFLNFQWDFGNNLSSIEQSETVTYEEPGNYTIVLDFEEDATGCPGQTTFDLEVQPYPTADFATSVDGQNVICEGQIEFIDQSIGDNLTYNWSFGNGQSSSNPNPTIGFEKGTYEVMLTVATTHGCIGDTTETFVVVGPEGDFVLDFDEICLGQEITATLVDTVDISSFSFDFNEGGITFDDQDPVTYEYQSGGTRTVSLILRSNEDACSFAINKEVNVVDVTADFIFENEGNVLCLGQDINLQNTSSAVANVFSWDVGGQTSQDENPTFPVSTTGEVEVQLIAIAQPLGCADTLTRAITISDLPVPQILGNTFCNNGTGGTFNLSVDNPNATSIYNWTYAGGSGSGTSIEIDGSNLTDDLIVTVMEIDENQCMSEDDITVDVVLQLPDSTTTVTTCIGAELFIPGTAFEGLLNDSDYTYAYQDNANIVSIEGLTALINTENEFESETFTITANSAVCDAANFNITVSVLNEVIQMPNVFTPNGDNSNDTFNYVITGGEDSAEIQVDDFRIFDRWGNLVYDNETPATGWNGEKDDKAAAADVYLYLIKYSLLDGGCELPVQKGDVTLIR